MSEEQVGFVTMGQAQAAADIPPIGIGMLGYAVMARERPTGGISYRS
jgi:hypothetical protein